MKRQLTKFLFLGILLLFIITLTSCSDDILSSSYYGYINSKEIELHKLYNGDPPMLDVYSKFKFHTQDVDIKSETICIIEFDFFSDEITDITLDFYWEYTTTVFNINHKKKLGEYDFVTNGDQQQISYELEEDDYFCIKNNKTQYLIVEVHNPSNANIIMNVPEIMLLTNDDEDALEDEFDKEFEED